MLPCAEWQIADDVSEQSIAFNFTVQHSYKVYSSRNINTKNGTTIHPNLGISLPVDMELHKKGLQSSMVMEVCIHRDRYFLSTERSSAFLEKL